MQRAAVGLGRSIEPAAWLLSCSRIALGNNSSCRTSSAQENMIHCFRGGCWCATASLGAAPTSSGVCVSHPRGNGPLPFPPRTIHKLQSGAACMYVPKAVARRNATVTTTARQATAATEEPTAAAHSQQKQGVDEWEETDKVGNSRALRAVTVSFSAATRLLHRENSHFQWILPGNKSNAPHRKVISALPSRVLVPLWATNGNPGNFQTTDHEEEEERLVSTLFHSETTDEQCLHNESNNSVPDSQRSCSLSSSLSSSNCW